jgi:hypothetical protein
VTAAAAAEGTGSAGAASDCGVSGDNLSHSSAHNRFVNDIALSTNVVIALSTSSFNK